jgi:hypothetical protein
VLVTPQEDRCKYCGHLMDDPDAQSRFDTGYTKIYAGIGIVLALVALIPVWFFPYQGLIAAAGAVAMGRFAQAENPYDTLGGICVAVGIGCGLAGWATRFVILANSIPN